MDKPKDDLDAVRIVVQTLDKFEKEERERIFRWAAEKLGMKSIRQHDDPSGEVSRLSHPVRVTDRPMESTVDLRSFIEAKRPKSDMHFAATVAYYYNFEAPPDKRKDAISAEDLLEAVRITNRERLKNPGQTLINAYQNGLLDKTSERGEYKINLVGENLVAVVLPDGTPQVRGTKRKTRSVKKIIRPGKAKKTNRTKRKAKTVPASKQ
jgi:hypothetical protein